MSDDLSGDFLDSHCTATVFAWLLQRF